MNSVKCLSCQFFVASPKHFLSSKNLVGGETEKTRSGFSGYRSGIVTVTYRHQPGAFFDRLISSFSLSALVTFSFAVVIKDVDDVVDDVIFYVGLDVVIKAVVDVDAVVKLFSKL